MPSSGPLSPPTSSPPISMAEFKPLPHREPVDTDEVRFPITKTSPTTKPKKISINLKDFKVDKEPEKAPSKPNQETPEPPHYKISRTLEENDIFDAKRRKTDPQSVKT